MKSGEYFLIKIRTWSIIFVENGSEKGAALDRCLNLLDKLRQRRYLRVPLILLLLTLKLHRICSYSLEVILGLCQLGLEFMLLFLQLRDLLGGSFSYLSDFELHIVSD